MFPRRRTAIGRVRVLGTFLDGTPPEIRIERGCKMLSRDTAPLSTIPRMIDEAANGSSLGTNVNQLVVGQSFWIVLTLNHYISGLDRDDVRCCRAHIDKQDISSAHLTRDQCSECQPVGGGTFERVGMRLGPSGPTAVRTKNFDFPVGTRRD